MKDSLDGFLEKSFDGLSIRKPLFYSWPIGIRFELSEPNMDREGNLKRAFLRASEILDFQLKKSRSVVLLYREPLYKRRKIRRYNPLFQSIHNLNSQEIKNDILPNIYADQYDNEKLNWQQVQIEVEIDRIDFRKLIMACLRKDFPSLGESLQGELYIIDMPSSTIFHIYDDRGMDVISAAPEQIFGLYQKYNDWILDYDRSKIENTFHTLANST